MNDQCTACTKAMTAPRIDLWAANCESCSARALAVTGAHVESKAAGRVTPRYVEVLKGIFGERWKEGAELVKQWAVRATAAQRLT
jgi:hypothetical protein